MSYRCRHRWRRFANVSGPVPFGQLSVTFCAPSIWSTIDRIETAAPLGFAIVMVPDSDPLESVKAGVPGVTFTVNVAFCDCPSNNVMSVGFTLLAICQLKRRVKVGVAVFFTVTNGRFSVLNSSNVAPVVKFAGLAAHLRVEDDECAAGRRVHAIECAFGISVDAEALGGPDERSVGNENLVVEVAAAAQAVGIGREQGLAAQGVDRGTTGVVLELRSGRERTRRGIVAHPQVELVDRELGVGAAVRLVRIEDELAEGATAVLHIDDGNVVQRKRVRELRPRLVEREVAVRC